MGFVRRVVVTGTRSDLEVVEKELSKSTSGIHGLTILEADPLSQLVFRITNYSAQIVFDKIQGMGLPVAVDAIRLSATIPIPKTEAYNPKLWHLIFRGLRDRVTIQEVTEVMESGAYLNFEYASYALLASWIAAAGLLSNMAVVVVAAMLVSPLMGPFLGMSLGIMNRDKSLFLGSLWGEFCGCCIAFGTGIIAGCMIYPFYVPSTAEMVTKKIGLLWGIAIAYPSGIGAALALAQGNGVNALVGVAISASDVPPMTNTGINLAFAVLDVISGGGKSNIAHHIEWAANSFLLYWVNVICIVAGSYTVLYIKHIFPKKAKKRIILPGHFWDDIPQPVIVFPEEEKSENDCQDENRGNDTASDAKEMSLIREDEEINNCSMSAQQSGRLEADDEKDSQESAQKSLEVEIKEDRVPSEEIFKSLTKQRLGFEQLQDQDDDQEEEGLAQDWYVVEPSQTVEGETKQDDGTMEH